MWTWGTTYGLPLPPLAAEFLTGFAERAALLGVVAGAASGFGGPVGWALSLPPVVYVGRVSYGLYLLHLFVPTMTVRVLRHVAWTPPVALEWVGEGAVLLAACALSWHFFERPINALKRHFPYVPRTAAPAEAGATAEPVRVPSL